MDTGERNEAPGLDLGRPELKEVLHRYVSPSVLLVGRTRSGMEDLRAEMAAHGWYVRECEGPGRTRCPLLEGRRCHVRDSVDVAVVYVHDATSPQGSSSPKVMCAAQGGRPAIVTVEGSLQPPRTKGRSGVVGALRPVEEIRALAGSLVEEHGSPLR